MANLGGTFDATQVDPSKPQDPIPPGDYRVQIINSEMRVTKAGTGQYLWLEMDVLDGPHAGRKTHDRLNLINPNAQAVEISQRALSAICHALGRMHVSDSENLHFQPLIVRVTVDKAGYNQIKGYKAIPGTMPTQQPAPAPVAQQTYQTTPAAQAAVQPAAMPMTQVHQATPQQATPSQAVPQQAVTQQPTAQGTPQPAPTSGGSGPWGRIQ